MYKYIPIKTVLNYVPRAVREEEDDLQLISYAFSGFRESVNLPNLKYEYKLVISQLFDHKAALPTGIKKIAEAAFSKTEPTPLTEDTDTYQGFELDFYTDFSGDAKVLVYQVLLFEELGPYFHTMRYVGQNPNLLTNDCLSVFCEDCYVNFSVSRDMSYVTCDEATGYVLLVTKSLITEDGDFMIPDDIHLLQALGYYVEAMHWRDKAARRQQGAEAMFEKRMISYSSKAEDFENKHTLRNLHVNKYATYVFDRFKGMQRLSTISGKRRNISVWRRY